MQERLGGSILKVGDFEYLRPATPPVFLMNQYLESIESTLSRDDAHVLFPFSAGGSSHAMLRRQKHQLVLWEGIIKEEVSRGANGVIERSLDALLERDPS